MPAVRRRSGGLGRLTPRLPGYRDYGGQALVLLEVTSLSVYTLSLFFGGLRGDGVDRGVASRREPPPVRDARRRPRVPRTPGGRRKPCSSLPGVTMKRVPERQAPRQSQGSVRWQLQLASRARGASPSIPALPQAKTAPHVSPGSPTRAIGRWRVRLEGAHSGTRLEALAGGAVCSAALAPQTTRQHIPTALINS